MWIDPYLTPAAVVLAVAAAAAAGWAVFSGKAKFLAVAGVCFLLGVAAFGAERLIVTEAEKVDALIDELADAAIRGNASLVLSRLSPSVPEDELPRKTLAMGLTLVNIDPDLRLTDRSTVVSANDTQATSDFRANGTARSPQLGNATWRFATKWQLVWRKEAGEWKIVRVIRFNPITEEPISVLAH